MSIFDKLSENRRKYLEYKQAGAFTNLPAIYGAPKKSYFRFRKLTKLAEKYDDQIYNLFGLSTALDNYEYLLSYGEDKLEQICNTHDITAAEAGRILYGDVGIDTMAEECNNYAATQISHCIKFNRATGLSLVEFNGMLNPAIKLRVNSKSMLDVFTKEDIDKEKLAQLSRIYGSRMFTEYRRDKYLLSKTIPNKNTNENDYNEYMKSMMDTGKMREVSDKYFKGDRLSEAEKHIVIGLLQKYSELIDKYKYSNLLKYSAEVKQDLDSGKFREEVVGNQETARVHHEDPAMRRFREAITKKVEYKQAPADEHKLSATKLREEKLSLMER